MRFYCAVYLLLPYCLLSQGYFEISEFTAVDQWERSSRFPVLESSTNKSVASKINTVLQLDMLEKIPGANDDNPFENVFPPEGEYWGQSEFSYNINRNDDKVFSVTISYEGTGAYSEYYSSYYSFASKTGDQLFLESFFMSDKLKDLGRKVNAIFHKEIEEGMDSIDVETEYGAEQFEMFEDCANSFADNDWLPSKRFVMDSNGITFIKGRCSNHAMMALDFIGEFIHHASFDELKPYLNESTVELIQNGTWHTQKDQLFGRVFTGLIDDKYPITIVIQREWGDGNLEGFYWYDKYKRKILLEGKREGNGNMELIESINEKQTGKLKIKLIEGVLIGEWGSLDNTKSLKLELK